MFRSVNRVPPLVTLLTRRLGLDPGRYRNSVVGAEEKAFASLDSQVSDSERFKEAIPFLVRCRNCQGQLPFSPLHDREVRGDVIVRDISIDYCNLVFYRPSDRSCVSRLSDYNERRKPSNAT